MVCEGCNLRHCPHNMTYASKCRSVPLEISRVPDPPTMSNKSKPILFSANVQQRVGTGSTIHPCLEVVKAGHR